MDAVGRAVVARIHELKKRPLDELLEARYQKFRRIAQLEQALQTGAEAVAETAETAEKLAEDEAPGLIPEGQEGVPPRRTPGSPRGRRL